MRLFWRLLCVLGFKCLPLTRFFALRSWLVARRGGLVAAGARLAGGSRIVGRGRLTIGADSWVGPYCLFFAHPDAPIEIGARCDIAPEVCFVTGTHAPGTPFRRAGEDAARPIRVGNGCWLGARVTVLAGVTIGDGAVVAAGAVVVSDVEPNTLVGGVPARLIRRLDEDGEAGCQA